MDVRALLAARRQADLAQSGSEVMPEAAPANARVEGARALGEGIASGSASKSTASNRRSRTRGTGC